MKKYEEKSIERIVKKLTKFLKSHGVSFNEFEAYYYEEHIRYTKPCGNISLDKFLRKNLLNVIDEAFVWGLTDYGYAFWDKVSREWRNVVKKEDN